MDRENKPLSEVSEKRRVFLLSNPDKPDAAKALEQLRAFAETRCRVVGTSLTLDGSEAVKAGAERVIILGGDGTLIGVARSLGAHQIPLIGVNVGKLGFLAEFSIDELRQVFERAIGDDSIISHRTVLQITVQHDGGVRDTSLAINDCVIQAGPPFRIVRLGVSINGEHLSGFGGDGLIACTPSGSTAHNLSAGGPIMQPGVDAIILTPLCAHSLTHKPLVIERESVIEIVATEVNEGTTAIIDGQVSCPLETGDRLTIRRFDHDFLLVHNPLYARWHNLVTKLHWGRAPNYE
ncbi:MAG: NAD(+)/NADH kinase [Phycisphaerae bacterium]|jgi:NAD+ kinase